MGRLKYVFATLLIICISIISVTFSTNIAIRYPEVLAYYLNDSQVLDYTDIGMKSNEFAGKVGKFFMGFDDSDQILDESGYISDPVFTDKEMEILLGIRYVNNIGAICGIASLLILIGIYIYMIKKREKDLLWKYCKRSGIIAIIVNVVYNILWAIPAIRSWMYDQITNVTLSKDSNLYLIATKGDWSTVLIVAQSLIALILIALIVYATRKITKSKRIFTR